MIEILSDNWIRFSETSWKKSGCPSNLSPQQMIRQPILYDRACYDYLEGRYAPIFHRLFRELLPTSDFIRKVSSDFPKSWRKFFDPVTLWKQLIPFFVFANNVGSLDQKHITLAKIFSVGQGIPSVVIDRYLDVHSEDYIGWSEASLFCLTAYSYSLRELQEKECDTRISKRYAFYTHEMYELMSKEWHSRYKIPKLVTDSTLRCYINGKESRLLSSVFFGIAVEWAYLISKKELPATFIEGILAFRKLRQLNDEIADFDDDIKIGIVTYPYLAALTSDDFASRLSSAIERLWRSNASFSSVLSDAELIENIGEILRQSRSFEKAALASMELANAVADAIMGHFAPDTAFEITMLVNLRIARLLRLKQNLWREIPKSDIYQPSVF